MRSKERSRDKLLMISKMAIFYWANIHQKSIRMTKLLFYSRREVQRFAPPRLAP